MTALILYGSSVADATVTTACDMAATTGGAETSKTTTTTGTNTYAEIFSQGGSTAGAVSIPATPTGKGWVYQPGAGIFNTDNWSASVTVSSSGWGGIGHTTSLTLRFFNYNGVTYTAIGTISAAVTGIAKTTYSFPGTSLSAMTFGVADLLYIDLWWHDDGTNIGGDNPVIYVSSSASQGVTNDLQITTSSLVPLVANPSVDIIGTGFDPGIPGLYSNCRVYYDVTSTPTVVRHVGPLYMSTYGWDGFSGRTTSGSLGVASDGQSYIVQSSSHVVVGTAAGFGSVSYDNAGAGSGTYVVTLGSQTAADADALLKVAFGSLTGNPELTLMLRYTDENNYYGARFLSGANGLQFVKQVSGVQTPVNVASPGLTAGRFYWLRFRLLRTTYYLKYWQDGTIEPDWQGIGTDSALSSAAGFGLRLIPTGITPQTGILLALYSVAPL